MNTCLLKTADINTCILCQLLILDYPNASWEAYVMYKYPSSLE